MPRSCIWSALLCLSVAQPSWAVVNFQLTMGDLPQQSVNGLVHPGTGVKFGFTVNGVASTDAFYNAFGPGSLTYVQDPSIEGNAMGVLSVTFPLATPLLQFGVARNTSAVLANGATVALFGPSSASIGSINLPLEPTNFVFAEGQFIYAGAPVKRAEISFPSVPSSTRFVFDNLVFTTPEPASAGLLLAAGLILIPRRLRQTPL